MKKLWKRFKNWLIKKLGGYTSLPPRDVVIVEQHAEPIIKLSAANKLFQDSVYRVLPIEEQWEVDNSIVERLIRCDIADAIIKQGLFECYTEVNPVDMTKEYKVIIKIAKPYDGGFRK